MRHADENDDSDQSTPSPAPPRAVREPQPREPREPPQPWGVTHVPAPPAEVAFSLTTGLGRVRGHPDLLVFDMPPPSARRYLDTLAARVRDGAVLCAGQLLDSLHPSYRFGLVQVIDREFLTDLARWGPRRWRDPDRPLLQLVWPDLCDTLPWEPGYSPAAGGLRQPLLGPWPRRRGRQPRRPPPRYRVPGPPAAGGVGRVPGSGHDVGCDRTRA